MLLTNINAVNSICLSICNIKSSIWTNGDIIKMLYRQITEIDIKHEGRTLAYIATLSEETYKPKLPDWLEQPPTQMS